MMLKLPMLLFQWRQAQMMMEYARRQLAVAVQKWQDLPEIPSMSVTRRPPLLTSASQSRLLTDCPTPKSPSQQNQRVTIVLKTAWLAICMYAGLTA